MLEYIAGLLRNIANRLDPPSPVTTDGDFTFNEDTGHFEQATLDNDSGPIIRCPLCHNIYGEQDYHNHECDPFLVLMGDQNNQTE